MIVRLPQALCRGVVVRWSDMCGRLGCWLPRCAEARGPVPMWKTKHINRPSHAVHWNMQFTRKGLKAEGFAGFRPMRNLETMRIPQGTGLFAVVAPEDFQARFLAKSTAGVFKKKDPSLSAAALAAEWVEAAVVLYLGKAGPGSKGNRGLRRQIQEFVDFGQGKPPGHWDGRLI